MAISLNERQQEAMAFFREHLKEWLSDPILKYKYAIIRGNALVGAHDTAGAALTEALSKSPQIDFVIQQIISDDDVVEYLYPALA